MRYIMSRPKSREGQSGSLAVSPLGYVRTEMDRLFDRILGEPWFGNGESSSLVAWHPSVDVSETEKEFVVRAEVPGVDPKDVSISIEGDQLTIEGEKKETKETKEENYYHCERSFGSFRRMLSLPSSVNPEHVKAEHKNGVVTITLEKHPGAMPKKIPIKES